MRAVSEIYASLLLIGVTIAAIIIAQSILIPLVSGLASSFNRSVDASMTCNRIKNPFGYTYPGIVVCTIVITCSGTCGGYATISNIMYASAQSSGSSPKVITITPSSLGAQSIRILQGSSSVSIVIPFPTGATEPVIVTATVASVDMGFVKTITAYL
ncbi:MAG: hypothetical protein QXE01_05125 [Sulfolobales archaeon]